MVLGVITITKNNYHCWMQCSNIQTMAPGSGNKWKRRGEYNFFTIFKTYKIIELFYISLLFYFLHILIFAFFPIFIIKG